MGWDARCLGRLADLQVVAQGILEWHPARGFHGTISVFDTRGKVLANGRLAYDDKNLYCAVIVPRAPLLNNSSSPQELMYGGDSIGICVGPSGGKGANQRFVCGLYAGKPTVVAMREQWPVAKP